MGFNCAHAASPFQLIQKEEGPGRSVLLRELRRARADATPGVRQEEGHQRREGDATGEKDF